MNQEALTLQHELIRVRAYLKNADKVSRENADPEVKADAAMLGHLYQRRAEGLGAEIEWAECQESGVGGEWARRYEEKARHAKEEAADLQQAMNGIAARVTKREAEKAAAAELKKQPRIDESSKPIVWKKTEVQLAAVIADWRENGFISGYDSESDAIRMCSAHFVVQTKNGDVKPIDPDSIVRNYAQTKRK